MGKRLYVGNIPFSITEEELKSLFGGAGTVESVSVIRDQASGRSKGFGFVEMGSEDQARDAVSKFDGTEVGGRNIRVSEAKSREGGEGGGGGGYRGGGGGGGYGGGGGGPRRGGPRHGGGGHGGGGGGGRRFSSR